MCCFVSECSKDDVRGWVCVCVCVYVHVSIASPFLDPTYCITRGSVLVSPGDSQSVLALQYKEKNCNFQETSSLVGLSIVQARVWDSST